MAHRSLYWSCTSFANWIRGIPKPDASNDWSEWEKRARKAHPLRYWIAEDVLDAMQNFLWWPLDKLWNLRCYIYHRCVVHTHACIAHSRNLQRGQWHDVGSRFLPCLFNELVNFVEIEIAGHFIAWGDEETRKKYNAPFWATGWFHWKTWRCSQAGLDYLNWAMTQTDKERLKENEKHLAQLTQQAVAAREIKELYTWWTQIYPKRPDPYESNCKEPHEIQKTYETEDTAMLVRLMHVRNRLWV